METVNTENSPRRECASRSAFVVLLTRSILVACYNSYQFIFASGSSTITSILI